MDEFVVHQSRKNRTVKDANLKSRVLKQKRLEQLKGVVVLERLEKAKDVFQDPNSDSETLLSYLSELSDKLPAVTIMKSSKIGRAVKRLSNHSDLEVASKAKFLVAKWTDHIRKIRSRPIIDVKCDGLSEKTRQKARKLLLQALEKNPCEERSRNLSFEIEKAVFFECEKRVGGRYPKLIRKLVRKVQYDDDIRTKVLTKDLTAGAFVDSVVLQ